MGVLLLLAFASPRALVIALLPVATGVVAGTATVSLVFGEVHGLTHGLRQHADRRDRRLRHLLPDPGARRRACRAPAGSAGATIHWPTVRLGLLTSVCGFAALVFSGFPGLAQLGVFSLAGLIAAALVARYVLPVLAPDGATGMGMRRHMAQVGRRASCARCRGCAGCSSASASPRWRWCCGRAATCGAPTSAR